ncbi:MAG: type I DNA topoisomerase [Candidatus Shapirobacteria bacterium]|nr:type I DNA topoisomerase [Candidatus Shapirobacteria bacterium]
MKLMKKLLIVESPTKARTITKYLSKDYTVLPTVGHLRDLPTAKMGVDLTTFEPDYVVDDKKKEVVGKLLKAAKGADMVILATDPDREGEAISWHVKWLIENEKFKNQKIVRATFHEITKEAVEEAISKPREVDMDMVNAQQGRRVLDRLVGYTLSPVLWKKVRRGLSAGRVQSVAVRLICEREEEIKSFERKKFFKINSILGKDTLAELIKIDNKNFVKTNEINLFDGNYTYTETLFDKQEKADKFVAGLPKKFVIEKVEEGETTRNPPPPYTTSKLQQAAARRFGWSGKMTMSFAQRLYERGLITYHRTDSVYLSEKAMAEFRSYISKTYGADYIPEKTRLFKNNSMNAQEAHEAIRPTSAAVLEPEDLDSKELKLYHLIWKRAVGSQAAAAKMKNSSIMFSGGNGIFKSTGVKILFDGFLKIMEEKWEDQILPDWKEKDEVAVKTVTAIEFETNPPPRYSDASLVASLEKQGIGRPSTYAPIISTIQVRQYVEKDEGKFKPTVLGVAANQFLVTNFANILSLPFTAEMELSLDKIALGKLEWKTMMRNFWKTFEPIVKKVEKDSERVKVEVEKTGEKCPECKEGELVIRMGKFGKFISCSRFPECKYTKAYQEDAGFCCPLCGAPGVVRKTKTGRKFFGCSNYPKCKWAGWKRP